ncbi:hypothetical protein RRG08_030480 [Elysia crispata]|uniref:Uncharacterized protein n=1 Tax=Elysia crispata TaxID=231223 RepID=A0AAE1AZU6_9GAST|nr:hypothetical protein RRG08_030480 [Elysia crispata]
MEGSSVAGQTKFIDLSIHGRIFLYESKSGVRFVKSGFFDSRDVIRKASIGNFFRLKGVGFFPEPRSGNETRQNSSSLTTYLFPFLLLSKHWIRRTFDDSFRRFFLHPQAPLTMPGRR